jgi:hypothetical protein
MKKLAINMFIMGLLSVLTACGGTGGCEPVITESIRLKIHDAETEKSISCGSQIKVHNDKGSLIESKDLKCEISEEGFDPSIRLLENYGAGTFIITVTKEGYEAAVSDPIKVVKYNDCRVLTVDTVIKLKKR